MGAATPSPPPPLNTPPLREVASLTSKNTGALEHVLPDTRARTACMLRVCVCASFVINYRSRQLIIPSRGSLRNTYAYFFRFALGFSSRASRPGIRQTWASLTVVWYTERIRAAMSPTGSV